MNPIFAASDQDKSSLVGCRFSISTSIGCRILGLPIPNGFYTARSEIVLVDKGVVQSFFCTSYYNFSYMTKTKRNCDTAQGASKATYTHETRKSLHSKFLIEKNAKNKAYTFILSNGLLSEFIEFSHTYGNQANTTTSRIKLILKNLPLTR